MVRTLTLAFFLLIVPKPLQIFESYSTSQEQGALPELPTAAQCEDIIKTVTPSIVQFSYDGFGNGPLHFGCGVIVSKEGHIAVSGPVHAVLNDKLLELRLSDGRKVSGKALGWSSEFGMGMLRITDSGEWPAIKLSARINAGQVCLAIGYIRNYKGTENRPDVRLDVVTSVSNGSWFTTSHQSDFSAHPVFNMRGELLGLNSSSPFHLDAIHTCASHIREHWSAFESGSNLDRQRLIADVEPKGATEKLPKLMSEETFAKVKAASVQIGDVGSKPLFSGVIVSDGYVVTCAHHNRLTGTKLNIVLEDGRSANAVVLGTNWLTDVGVLKITDEGEWPFVGMGYSSRLAPGEPVIVIGYPVVNEGKQMVLKTRVIAPTQTLKSRDDWHKVLWTARDADLGNVGGASGGGAFDTSGNLIGIHTGGVELESMHTRVELLHKNWPELTSSNTIETIDPKTRRDALKELKQLMSDLSSNKQKP